MKPGSGQISPVRSRTMKEYDQVCLVMTGYVLQHLLWWIQDLVEGEGGGDL